MMHGQRNIKKLIFFCH